MIHAHRAWVVQSNPSLCAVCEGLLTVVLWPVGAPELAVRRPCPHCQNPNLPIKILHPRQA